MAQKSSLAKNRLELKNELGTKVEKGVGLDDFVEKSLPYKVLFWLRLRSLNSEEKRIFNRENEMSMHRLGISR